MKRCLLCVVLFGCVALAQDKKPIGPPAPSGQVPTSYEPSELQRLKLENAQQKIIIIALQIQPLEQKRQEQIAALSQLCETIRKENHWPDDVKCEPASLKFSAVAPKPERPPVPPPPSSPGLKN